MSAQTLRLLKAQLLKQANPQKAKLLQSFFKTGPGQYGEGDRFLGLTVPQQRRLAGEYAAQLNFADLDKLLKSKIHEQRLVALLVLVDQFQQATDNRQQAAIFRFYLAHSKNINNWDLVDLSAPKIVGAYLRQRDKSLLYKLAQSKNLWQRRIAMLATFDFIYYGNPRPALKIAGALLADEHDLIHKAVGWMLREAGKRCGEKILTGFLDRHYQTMPRTMLRYAIERLDAKSKKFYMAKTFNK